MIKYTIVFVWIMRIFMNRSGNAAQTTPQGQDSVLQPSLLTQAITHPPRLQGDGASIKAEPHNAILGSFPQMTGI